MAASPERLEVFQSDTFVPRRTRGQPIALVENGDVLNIDLTRDLIEVEVSDEELAKRREKWRRSFMRTTVGCSSATLSL